MVDSQLKKLPIRPSNLKEKLFGKTSKYGNTIAVLKNMNLSNV
jgi:hypothetical protein